MGHRIVLVIGPDPKKQLKRYVIPDRDSDWFDYVRPADRGDYGDMPLNDGSGNGTKSGLARDIDRNDLPRYANVLHRGKWIMSDEGFQRILADLPGDTLLSVFDCHCSYGCNI